MAVLMNSLDFVDVPKGITRRDAVALARRLERRNYCGRSFVINQRNSRQLQLDVEAALKLCRYFARRQGIAAKRP